MSNSSPSSLRQDGFASGPARHAPRARFGTRPDRGRRPDCLRFLGRGCTRPALLDDCPILVGDGIPGVRFAGADLLADAITASVRRFSLGADICTVFDFAAAREPSSRYRDVAMPNLDPEDPEHDWARRSSNQPVPPTQGWDPGPPQHRVAPGEAARQRPSHWTRQPPGCLLVRTVNPPVHKALTTRVAASGPARPARR